MRTHCTAQGTRVCCTAQLSAARWPEREANPREGVHVNTEPIHSAVRRKQTQHYKATIIQQKLMKNLMGETNVGVSWGE